MSRGKYVRCFQLRVAYGSTCSIVKKDDIVLQADLIPHPMCKFIHRFSASEDIKRHLRFTEATKSADWTSFSDAETSAALATNASTTYIRYEDAMAAEVGMCGSQPPATQYIPLWKPPVRKARWVNVRVGVEPRIHPRFNESVELADS